MAELEIAAGERPKVRDVGLPDVTGQRVRQWAEDEETRIREMDEVAEELCQVMQAHGYDTGAIREAMDG